MSTTRLSSRGQIVLPKEIRDEHHWSPGQEFEIVEASEGILLRPRSPFPETTFEDVRGATQYEGARIPNEQLTGKEALRKMKTNR